MTSPCKTAKCRKLFSPLDRGRSDASMRHEPPQQQRRQQLVEPGRLKQTGQQNSRSGRCSASLFTGSIRRLAQTGADAHGSSANCGMANNHGLSSDELDFNEAAMLAAATEGSAPQRYFEDRRDSDSQCLEEADCRDQSDPSHQRHSHSAEMRHAVKCQHRFQQLQLFQTRQQQRQLIIPKRLQLEARSTQPQISGGGSRCSGKCSADCEDQVEDELASTDSDEIFPPTATVTGSGHDDSEGDDNAEACRGPQPAGQPCHHQRCEHPVQCQDLSVITDEDGRSASDQPNYSSRDSRHRQEHSVELSPYALPPPPLPRRPPQPPVSLTIDRQVVRLTSGPRQRHHHQHSRHSRRVSSLKGKEEDAEETNDDEDVNVASLQRQLRQIEHCRRHKEVAAQGAPSSQGQMLCTSGSNCCTRRSVSCRGSSGGHSPEGSPESSLGLVLGTTMLCRPGSLPGLNIDGLVARRMRCTHETIKEDDENIEQRIGASQLAKSSKKTVSFSTADPSGHQSSEGGSDTAATASETVTHTATPEADILEHDSERSEHEKSRRGSFRAGGAPCTIEIPVTPQAPKVQLEQSEGEEILTSPQKRLAAPLQMQSAPRSSPGSLGGDSNIELAVGEVTVSENANSGQKVASRFRLAADSEMTGTARTENEQQQQEQMPEMEELDLLSSDPYNDTPGHEMVINESNAKLLVGNSALQLTTSPTALRGVSGVRNQRRPQSSHRKQLAAVCDSLRHSLTRRDPKHSAKRCRSSRDSTCQASPKLRHSSGSNCANSSAAAQRHSGQHRRERPQLQQQYSVSSTGYGTWTEKRTGEAEQGDDSSPLPSITSAARDPSTTSTAAATVGCQASYVVFQHPPEVATAKRAATLGKIGFGSFDGTSGSHYQSSLEGDCCFCSDESLAFSWVSSLGNESNAVDLSLSLDEGSFNESSRTSSRHRRQRRRPSYAPGEVTFQQLCTTEDCLYKLSPIVSVSAIVMAGDVRNPALQKPSALTDFAARSSIARTVFQPISSDASCTQEEEDEEERQLVPDDDRTDSGSASDPPFLMLEALSCGHDGLNCFGCYRRRQPMVGQALHPQTPQLPPEPSLARSSRPSMVSAMSSSPPAESVDAGALRDLLATVFNDPSEGRALTRALMRGLLCNVESLRSTLAAAMVLLKDRRGFSGPLTQAIGTANTLDDLIRQLQVSQRSRSRNRSLRRRRLQQHQQQQQRLFSSEIDCTTEDDEERSSSASVVADAIQRCLHHRRQHRGRPVEHRCVSLVPVDTVQCHAMSHYVIGEQFVEPSLEQRSSMECRPVTTRVVLTEATKSVSQPRGSRVTRK